jgi:hypothetical protein
VDTHFYGFCCFGHIWALEARFPYIWGENWKGSVGNYASSSQASTFWYRRKVNRALGFKMSHIYCLWLLMIGCCASKHVKVKTNTECPETTILLVLVPCPTVLPSMLVLLVGGKNEQGLRGQDDWPIGEPSPSCVHKPSGAVQCCDAAICWGCTPRAWRGVWAT